MDQLSDKYDNWLEQTEGQLAVDISETNQELIVRTAIAGVAAEDLDIAVTNDTITIRGSREKACARTNDETVHLEECFWGMFSRSIVLPSNVLPNETDAEIKNGVLTIRLKKVEMSSKIPVLEIEG
jgi:HSP20 family protein